MTITINQTIAKAFANTPAGYLEQTFAMRNPDLITTAGSFFAVPQTVDSLLAADWIEFDPGAARFGECRYFKARIDGYLGIVPLDWVDEDGGYELLIAPGHDSKPGMAELHVRSAFGPEMAMETTLVIGPHEGRDVVHTFHPGMPVLPVEVTLVDAGGVGLITKAAAKALGFTHAKAVA